MMSMAENWSATPMNSSETSMKGTIELTLVGPPGVGKTTIAQRCSETLNVQPIQIDQIYLDLPAIDRQKREALQDVQAFSQDDIKYIFEFEKELFLRKSSELFLALHTSSDHVIDGGVVTNLIYLTRVFIHKKLPRDVSPQKLLQQFLADEEISSILTRLYSGKDIFYIYDSAKEISQRVAHRYYSLPPGAERDAREYELKTHTEENTRNFQYAQSIVRHALEEIGARSEILTVPRGNKEQSVTQVVHEIAHIPTYRRLAA